MAKTQQHSVKSLTNEQSIPTWTGQIRTGHHFSQSTIQSHHSFQILNWPRAGQEPAAAWCLNTIYVSSSTPSWYYTPSSNEIPASHSWLANYTTIATQQRTTAWDTSSKNNTSLCTNLAITQQYMAQQLWHHHGGSHDGPVQLTDGLQLGPLDNVHFNF